MMRSELEETVLSKVKPLARDREKVMKVADALLEVLRSWANGRFRPLLVGSVAKGTFLKDPDIDVFLLYPEKVAKENMAREALTLGREILDDPVEKYAEHPYVHGTYGGYNTDIVPCYEIEDMDSMRSSVDRTPLHTLYIKNNLPSARRDDVLLLKAFLRGIGAYGAHARVKGFSGYLCELMVLHYGTFEDVLRAASGWRLKETVEVVEAKKEFHETFVFVDPVDPGRNVASAVEKETFALFVFASKTYLESPDISYFFPRKPRTRSADELKGILKERGTHLVTLSLPRPELIDDNLYPQVEKACKKLHEHMEKNDFTVLHSDYHIDHEIVLLFELEHGELSGIERHGGPPVFHPNTVNFLKKYGDKVYIKGHRLMTDKERKYRRVSDLIGYLVRELDLGSDITVMMEKELRIVEGEDTVKFAPGAVDSFMDRTFPWER